MKIFSLNTSQVERNMKMNDKLTEGQSTEEIPPPLADITNLIPPVWSESTSINNNPDKPRWKESVILNFNNPEFKLWIINDDGLFKPNISIKVDVITFVDLMSKMQKPEVNILGSKKIQYIYKGYVDIELYLKLDTALNNYIKRKIDALISKGNPAGEELTVSVEAFRSLADEKITCCEFLKNLAFCGLNSSGMWSKCLLMFEVIEQE